MQTEKILLPEHPDHPGIEQWAEIRTVRELRAGDAKAVHRAMRFKLDKAAGGWDGSFSPGDEDARVDALLVRVIVTWSYELPLPVADSSSLDELPLDAWEALSEATAEHREALDFTRKKNPTPGEDSSDSRTSSEESTSPDTSQTKTSSK